MLVLVKEKNIPPIPRALRPAIAVLKKKQRNADKFKIFASDWIKKADSFDKLTIEKKIVLLNKKILVCRRICNKFEKLYDIPSEQIINMEPMEFENWNEIDNWISNYKKMLNYKELLSQLIK